MLRRYLGRIFAVLAVLSLSAAVAPTRSEGAPTDLHVLGLGDSVAAGSGCDCLPVPERYAQLRGERDHTSYDTTNLAKSGLTTSDLLDQLTNDEDTITAAQTADVIIVIVGANDLAELVADAPDPCLETCLAPPVVSMAITFDEVMQRLDALRKPDSTVLVTGYWNVFLDGQVGRENGAKTYDLSLTVTDAANLVLSADSERHGATFVDLATPFKGADGSQDPTSLLAEDGDHPNEAGTELIAQELLAHS